MPVVYHPSPLQVVQVAKETTHGTVVTATKRLPGIGIRYWSPMGANADILPSGYIIPTGTMHTKEWSEAPFDGLMTYGELPYLLDSAFIVGAVTGAGPYVWTHTPLATAINTFTSYSMVSGDATAAYGYGYAHVSDLNLSFSRDACRVSGTWRGARQDPTVTLAGSPTVVEMAPVQPQHVGIYTAASMAGLSAGTRVLGDFTVDMGFSGIRTPVWTLDDSQTSFADTVIAVPGTSCKISIVADLASGDYNAPVTLAKWRLGTNVYLQVKTATGDANHTLTINCALNIRSIKHTDANGIFTLDAECVFVNDATAAQWVQFVTTDMVAAL